VEVSRFRPRSLADIALLAGAATGLAVGSMRDSRMLARWEARNGRLFVEGKSCVIRRRRLYVEDPAVAPLDAT
jgi:hypothetical protein